MKDDLNKIISELEYLSKLLTERIYENNVAQEHQPGLLVKQFVHAFLLYRNIVDESLRNLNKIVNKIPNK